jgi:hypothetical protein
MVTKPAEAPRPLWWHVEVAIVRALEGEEAARRRREELTDPERVRVAACLYWVVASVAAVIAMGGVLILLGWMEVSTGGGRAPLAPSLSGIHLVLRLFVPFGLATYWFHLGYGMATSRAGASTPLSWRVEVHISRVLRREEVAERWREKLTAPEGNPLRGCEYCSAATLALLAGLYTIVSMLGWVEITIR